MAKTKYTKEEQLNVDLLELIKVNIEDIADFGVISGLGNNISKAMDIYNKQTGICSSKVVVFEYEGTPEVNIHKEGSVITFKLKHYRDVNGINSAIDCLRKII